MTEKKKDGFKLKNEVTFKDYQFALKELEQLKKEGMTDKEILEVLNAVDRKFFKGE